MKRIASLLALGLLVVLISSSYASENVPIDAASIAKASHSSLTDSFGVIVTGDNKLTTKAGPVFTEGGDYSGMVLPYLLSNPKPISYPRWAVRQGWQGQSVIAIEVLTDGTVGRYKVLDSTGYRILDDEATKAVRRWKFHPATKDGEPIVTCVQIPIFFKLEAKED